MGNVTLVQVVHSPEELSDDLLDFAFFDAVGVANRFKEFSSSDVLADDVKPFIILEQLQNPDDVGVVDSSKNVKFLGLQLFDESRTSCIFLHDFYGALDTRGFVLGDSHFSKAAFANDFSSNESRVDI